MTRNCEFRISNSRLTAAPFAVRYGDSKFEIRNPQSSLPHSSITAKYGSWRNWFWIPNP